jgi:hypothetical protein
MERIRRRLRYFLGTLSAGFLALKTGIPTAIKGADGYTTTQDSAAHVDRISAGFSLL